MTEAPQLTTAAPDDELDLLAYLQKMASNLVAFAVKRGYITPPDDAYLYSDIAGASMSNIWSVIADINGKIEYAATDPTAQPGG